MTQLSIEALCVGGPTQVESPLQLDPNKMQHVIHQLKVGSILNVGPHAHSPKRWQEIIEAVQSSARSSRLGIPILYGIDSIHGANYTLGSTLFPQQLGQAASWNLEMAEKLAAIAAYETRASGIPWTFSPVLDMGRQASWPRLWETYGEDVHLVTQMGLAAVKGYQGDNMGASQRVAACLKHYAGYGFPLTGHDRTPAYMGETQLREYHLAPFAEAVKAGAATVMINSGEINGEPVHASHKMLTQILRDEMGFEGIAVTDWEDIRYLHTRHRVADSHKEAVRMAVEAGVDMSMVPFDASFTTNLLELVKEGSISEERIDLSVRRILQVKYDLGLFEKTHEPLDTFPDFASPAFQELNRQAARESLVLLKNDKEQLPLDPAKKFLVCGPTADSRRSLNGGWSYNWQGDKADELAAEYATVLDALRQRLTVEKLVHVPGCTYDSPIDLEAVRTAAEQVDHILLCLGEYSYTEFFGNIDDMDLPSVQYQLAETLAETGKPISLILLQGRPRIITRIEPLVGSILLGLYPGNEGGHAMVEALFGDFSPSGKLPITYPRFSNALTTYDHKLSESQGLQGAAPSHRPLYEFGHGLSYTQFAYSDLKLDKASYGREDVIEASVQLHNRGERAAKEVVQLYVRDLFASLTPPVRRLRAFQKLSLEAGESRQLRFSLPIRDLAFVNAQQEWVVEPGAFELYIGDLQAGFGVE
ncbi:MAG: glycoside hydrolase family 3 N-terminal domain-containing protein [Bacteroidota bacterium]